MPEHAQDRPVAATAVRDWMARHGFTERGAASALGVGPATMHRIARDGATRLQGLAMAALDAGLDPLLGTIAQKSPAEPKQRRRAYPFRERAR